MSEDRLGPCVFFLFSSLSHRSVLFCGWGRACWLGRRQCHRGSARELVGQGPCPPAGGPHGSLPGWRGSGPQQSWTQGRGHVQCLQRLRSCKPAPSSLSSRAGWAVYLWGWKRAPGPRFQWRLVTTKWLWWDWPVLEVFHRWQQKVSWEFSCLELSLFLSSSGGPARRRAPLVWPVLGWQEESDLHGCWTLEAWGLGGHSCWSVQLGLGLVPAWVGWACAGAQDAQVGKGLLGFGQVCCNSSQRRNRALASFWLLCRVSGAGTGGWAALGSPAGAAGVFGSAELRPRVAERPARRSLPGRPPASARNSAGASPGAWSWGKGLDSPDQRVRAPGPAAIWVPRLGVQSLERWF